MRLVTLRPSLWGWVYGWYTTLMIRHRNPKLYKLLTEWTDSDLFEVEEPK